MSENTKNTEKETDAVVVDETQKVVETQIDAISTTVVSEDTECCAKSDDQPAEEKVLIPLGLSRSNGAYHYNNGKSFIKQSNFVFKLIGVIQHTVDGCDEWHARIEIQSNGKDKNGNKRKAEILTISPKAWQSAKNWNKEMGSNSWYIFSGNDRVLLAIQQLECSGNNIHVKGVKRDGIVKVKDKHFYIEGDRCIGEDGKPSKQVCNIDAINKGKINMLKNKDVTKEDLESILPHLFSFNSPDICYPLLAYCFSCFFKERLLDVTDITNPMLIGYGLRGCGKTQTINKIVANLFSSSIRSESATSVTEFILIKKLSQTSMVPIHYDEFKNLDGKRKALWSWALKALYNHIGQSRGTSDQKQINYYFNAPLIITGEVGITEPAILERLIEIDFSESGRDFGTKHFMAIDKNILKRIGKSFLKYALKQEQEYIEETYKACLKRVDQNLPDRLITNQAMILNGFIHFTKFLQEMGISNDVLKPIVNEGVETLSKTFEKTQQDNDTNVLHDMMKLFNQMIVDGDMRLGKQYNIDSDKKYLYLHLSRFHNTYCKCEKNYEKAGYELLPLNTFKRYLKQAPFFTSLARQYMWKDDYDGGADKELDKENQQRLNVWQLDLKILQDETNAEYTYKKEGQEFYNKKGFSSLDSEEIDEPNEPDEQTDFEIDIMEDSKDDCMTNF